VGEPTSRRDAARVFYRVERVHGDGRLTAAIVGEVATLLTAERLALGEQRLVVHRQRLVGGDARLGEPAPHRPLERRRVQPLGHPVQRRHTGTAPRRQAQRQEQRRPIVAALLPPLGHRVRAGLTLGSVSPGAK
jgi:hypothetical protein